MLSGATTRWVFLCVRLGTPGESSWIRWLFDYHLLETSNADPLSAYEWSEGVLNCLGRACACAKDELTKQDDPDCLVCAEPLDLSDLKFKPCQCGMQVRDTSLSNGGFES